MTAGKRLLVNDGHIKAQLVNDGHSKGQLVNDSHSKGELVNDGHKFDSFQGHSPTFTARTYGLGAAVDQSKAKKIEKNISICDFSGKI